MTPSRLPTGEKLQTVTKPESARIQARRVVSLKEACAYIGQSIWVLRRALKAGEIVARKDGRRTLVELWSLDAYLDSRPIIGKAKEARDDE
jgi:hypothetical protein